MVEPLKEIKVVIDGIDGTGKSTIIKILKEKYKSYLFKDRGILTPLTLLHWKKMPKQLNRDFDFYIILESDPEIARSRLLKRYNGDETKFDEWETPESLFFYLKKYRYLAGKYGDMYVIDTTKKNIEEVVQEVEKVFNGDKTNYIPCIDKLTPEDFQKLD